jgi:hypothetical protein
VRERALLSMAYREQRALQRRADAALRARAGTRGIEEGGATLLGELPWLAEVEPAAFARIVWGLQPELRDRPPLLSLKWRLRLEAAVRCADRYADLGQGRRGAGHALIVDLIRGGWQSWRDGSYRPAGHDFTGWPFKPFLTWDGPLSQPLSLGAIAVCVRRQAHAWRRHDIARNARRGRRLRPTAASRRALRRRAEGGGASGC